MRWGIFSAVFAGFLAVALGAGEFARADAPCGCALKRLRGPVHAGWRITNADIVTHPRPPRPRPCAGAPAVPSASFDAVAQVANPATSRETGTGEVDTEGPGTTLVSFGSPAPTPQPIPTPELAPIPPPIPISEYRIPVLTPL